MNQQSRWTRHAQLIVILVCALSLKIFYSTASANQLRWILAPTALLVELVSGERFAFESYAGYINDSHSFLIAPSCAGINFLMSSFLMLSLFGLLRTRSRSFKWRLIPMYAFVAYVATLVANTVRITTALQLRGTSREILGLGPAEVHRIEGILIYFGFLLLVFLISERISGDAEARERAPLYRIRRYLVPLLVYYATTLVIPLATSAYRTGAIATEFWEHLLLVFLTPIVVLLPLSVFYIYRHVRASASGAICSKDYRPLTDSSGG